MEDRIEEEFRQIREIIEKSLVGETVYTLAQSKPNHIVDADEEGLTVRARTEREVGWELVRAVYRAVVHLGEIGKKDVQQGKFADPRVYRCAFIFPLLARFAHIESRTNPLGLIYHEPHGAIRLSTGGSKV